MKELNTQTLAHLCLSASAKYKDKPAFAMLSEGKICRKFTYTQMGELSSQIGSLLKRLGVENGDTVLLFSENSPEWALAYFGIALSGAVSVPLLTGFSPDQIQNIIEHSNVSAICTSLIMSEKIKHIADLPLIYIDTIIEDKISISINGNMQQITMPLAGCSIPSGGCNDLASIIYTSGTQGNNKGVMLSGKNLISSALSSLTFLKMYPRDRFLSVLPLAHSYECGLGLLAPVISGASITYLDKPPSVSVLLPAFKLIRPTAMFSVPLLIEKIYANAIAPKLKANKLYNIPLTRNLAIRVAGRKLIGALGGRIRMFGIGGAPLSPEVEKFLVHARFPFSIGYGLTEAAPLVAGHSPLRFTSGLNAPRGVSVRIVKNEANAETGEIQVKGPNVMMGYYKDSERTAETLTADGWLKTGDLGRIDNKGRVHIKGRIKALILGPSGENIYPEEIEGLLGSSGLVEDALVYSGEKGELIAIVSLSEAAKAAAGAVEQALEDLRSWVNKKLAVFSRVSRIQIKYEPFEKTPTMKIKRYLYST
ncbi:MAG: AMP-binding protein [Treponema sp.]|nr:AMP-binding protein [Treponema sp.]